MVPKYRAWNKKEKSMWHVRALLLDQQVVWLVEFGEEGENEQAYPCSFENCHLMQSTGLKDKNGVEIFEGDIVKVHRFQQGHVGGNYGVVEVEEEMVCVVEKATVEPYIYPCEWFLVDVYDEEPENLWLSSGLHEESYEVIGNIFENESLLKELE